MPAEPLSVPRHGYALLVELEPGFKSFLSNLGDVFRRPAPRMWLTSAPGEYWPDALVNRPVAWKAIVQSYLAHGLAVGAIYAGCLWWLNQPHVLVEEPLQTATILNYQVSEYLPEVKPKSEQQAPPRRKEAHAADPEYSPQKIVSLNVDRRSVRQTIVQADPTLLSHDVRMPNIVTWTPVPIAPPETAHQRLLDLPSGAPVVTPPAQPPAEHGTARLTFPPAAQPEVAPPSGPVTASRTLQMPAIDSPVIVPPTQEIAARDPSRLQLQVQAPQVAAAPSDIASRTAFSNQAFALAQPAVIAPAPGEATGPRHLSATALPDAAPNVAPPAPPIASAIGQQSRDAGQLLALNASPLPPDGPIKVPAGNRQGEFAAGPEGHSGASATPETMAGAPSMANRSGSGGAGSVYVEAPPVKIAGGTVVAGPRLAPPLAAKAPAAAASDVPSGDPIDNQVFGGRRRYSMRLNLPNISSAMGSWTIKFAELNMSPADHGDLTAPEAIRKVDPAYPANLMKDRVEGVVVLRAVIRSDGTVAEVRILEGFYDELDENARAALEQWRFRPGTKNGIPVDVEAVIRVPFRVARSAF